MELAPLPKDADDPFVPDLTEGAEAGLYLSLFELMNEGLIIASDERILEVNSATCRLMERSYRDLAGQPLSTLFASERAFLAARAALFIQGEMRGSLRVTLPGGRERDLAYVAAARIRPGVHALILSADPVTGHTPQTARAADTVWPRLAAALDQAALVIDARDHIIAANPAARRRFGTAEAALTGYPLSALCTLSDPERENGPVSVRPVDGSPEIHGRLLAGPEPGWRILLLSGQTRLAPVDGHGSRAFRQAAWPMLVVRASDRRIVAANDIAASTYGLPSSGLLKLRLDDVRCPCAVKAPFAAGVWLWRGANGDFAAETVVQPLDGTHEEWLLMHDTPNTRWPEALPLRGEVFANHGQPVLITDAALNISSTNAAFDTLSGRAGKALRGMPLDELLHPEARATDLMQIQRAARNGGSWQGEMRLHGGTGAPLTVALSLSAVRNSHNEITGHIGVCRALPVPAKGDAHIALDHLQSRFDHARHASAHRQSLLALICLDIDGFEAIETRFGGALLQQVAARLTTCGASIESAWLNANRFVALITDLASMRDVSREVDGLRRALAAPFDVDAQALALTASVGVAVCPHDGTAFSTLVEHATAAMQRARLDGNNRCLFHDAATNAARFERTALECALAQAIEQDTLAIHFQPVRDGSTGGLVAAEALLRWNHPDLGWLSPRDFMTSAEDAGHDLAIGWHALRLACQHAAEWHRAGVAIPVAIAVSRRLIAQDDFVDSLDAALRDTMLPASAIELNLPEACLWEDSDRIDRTLRAIDQLGVRLALTAIGTHPLPIGRLHRLPVGTFKLHRELIRDLGDSGDATVLEVTISVIMALTRSVQAVGVETEAQAQQLLGLGCERQQGRLYAAPMPANEFAQLL